VVVKKRLKKIGGLLKNDPSNIELLCSKAVALSELEEYVEAISIFKKVISQDSKFAYAWFELGRTYGVMDNHLKEALAALETAIKLNPYNSANWSEKGFVLYLSSRYDEAIESCDVALSLNLNNDAAWAFKSVVHLELQKTDEALKAANESLKIDPNDWFNWSIKGDVLQELEKYDEAIDAYKKALKIEDELDRVWHDLGFCYLEKKDYFNAIKAFQKDVKLSASAHSWTHIAEAYEKMGKNSEALKAYNTGLKIEKNSSELLQNKGVLLSKLKRDKEAIKCYEKAHSLLEKEESRKKDFDLSVEKINEQFTLSDLIRNKAISLRKLGKQSEALKTIEERLEKDPYEMGLVTEKIDILSTNGNYLACLATADRFLDLFSGTPSARENPYMLNIKARAIGSLGQFEDALKYFNEGLEMCSKISRGKIVDPPPLSTEKLEGKGSVPFFDIEWAEPKLLEGKLLALFYLKKFQEALPFIENKLKKEPNNIKFLYAKGFILINSKKFDSALDCFHKVLQIDENNFETLIATSAVLTRIEKYKEAMPYIERILKTSPKNYLALAHKGIILIGLKQIKKGLQLIEKSIKNEPNNGFLWFARAIGCFMLGRVNDAVSNLMVATYADFNVIQWANDYPQIKAIQNVRQWKSFQKLVVSSGN